MYYHLQVLPIFHLLNLQEILAYSLQDGGGPGGLSTWPLFLIIFLFPHCGSDVILLIGKHAIPSLVKNLPGGQQTQAKNLSEDTVISVLNTINEVIADNLEAAKKLRETQGIEKLVLINKSGWVEFWARWGGSKGGLHFFL